MKSHYAGMVILFHQLKEDVTDFFGRMFTKGYKSRIDKIIEAQREARDDRKYTMIDISLPQEIIELEEMIDLVTAIDSTGLTASPEISDDAKKQISQLSTDEIKLLIEVLKTSPEKTKQNSELAKRLAYVSSEYKKYVLEEGPIIASDTATYDMFNFNYNKEFAEEDYARFDLRDRAISLSTERVFDYQTVATVCSKLFKHIKTTYPEEYSKLELLSSTEEELTLGKKAKEKKI